jgi:hypothetical protein
VEPWKELLSLPPHELEKVAYNDPRLDSFASTVEQRYGLPNGLIEAVKNAGEKSNSTQQSPKGAKGVMQFIDSTRKAYDHDVRDPLASIDAAGKYFKDLLQQYNGNPKAAIAAYNGGTAAGKAVLEGKDAPAEETRSYWKRIQGYMEKKYGVNAEKVQREGEGGEFNRTNEEKRPAITAKELFALGFDTEAGRKTWYQKVEKEWKDGQKGLSRAQKDKYYSSPLWLAREKYPDMANMYEYFDKKGDMPVAVKSYLEAKNPKISFRGYMSETKGFVFSDNGDRVFLNHNSDWNTMVHEAEHLQQQADFKKMGLNAPHAQVGMIGNMSKPVAKLMNWTMKNRDDPGVEEVWRASNAHSGSNEWLANLQGFMKTGIPEGKSWSDTAFFKKLSKDVGEKEAMTMLLDALGTLARADYSVGRIPIRGQDK